MLSRVADALFWMVAGTGLAALAAGGVMLVLATRPSLPTSQVESLRLGGDFALISGGALAITAAVLYLVRDALPPNTPMCVTASIGPQSVAVGFTF